MLVASATRFGVMRSPCYLSRLSIKLEFFVVGILCWLGTSARPRVNDKGPSHHVLNCGYDSHSLNGGRGLYQEPERVFSHEDWQQHRLEPYGWQQQHAAGSDDALPSFDQEVRLNSLRKIYGLIPWIFKTHLPTVKWALMSGSLIAALRSGTIIPWDVDGDLLVSDDFNTDTTMRTLLEISSPPQWLTSQQCRDNAKGGKCLFVPVSDDVALGIHPLPTNYEWIGRFVDLRTGYFVELFPDRGHVLVDPLRQAYLEGVLQNLPHDPIKTLAQDIDNPILRPGQTSIELDLEKMSACSLLQCIFQSQAFLRESHRTNALPKNHNPFNVSFILPNEKETSNEWMPVYTDKIDFRHCRQADEAVPGSILVRPTYHSELQLQARTRGRRKASGQV